MAWHTHLLFWRGWLYICADVNGSFIIWHLVDVVSKGGLMQIGYGPDKDGEFHPLAVKALEFAGDWMAVNGEAIYRTRSMPLHWVSVHTPPPLLHTHTIHTHIRSYITTTTTTTTATC